MGRRGPGVLFPVHFLPFLLLSPSVVSTGSPMEVDLGFGYLESGVPGHSLHKKQAKEQTCLIGSDIYFVLEK